MCTSGVNTRPRKVSPASVSHKAYEQTHALLDELARAGTNRLPPEPDLAGQLGVSRVTIRRVLARLQAERWIDRQKGRGTFIRPRRKTKRIVVFHGSHVSLFQPWMAGILQGISRECAARNVVLELRPLALWGDRGLVPRMIAEVRSQQVDGYVVVQRLHARDAARICRADVPLVMVECDYGRSDIPAVLTDHGEAARLAAGIFRRQGCRRIALVSGPTGGETLRKADVIARTLQAELGAGAQEPVHMVTDRSVEEGRGAMCALLDGGQPPDGVLTTDDNLAAGALLAVQGRGTPSRPMPQIVSYLDPHSVLRQLIPWPAIEIPATNLVGREAVRLALELIDGQVPEQGVRWLSPRLG